MTPERIISKLARATKRAGGFIASAGKGNITAGQWVLPGRRGSNTGKSGSVTPRRAYHQMMALLAEVGKQVNARKRRG